MELHDAVCKILFERGILSPTEICDILYDTKLYERKDKERLTEKQLVARLCDERHLNKFNISISLKE